MVADGMLTRKRYREVPPRVDYELTERARELMPVLGELARWGYEWAWGAPRPSERVDIGAIFRLAPGLMTPAPSRGTVELIVSERNQGGGAAFYKFTASGDGVAIEEHAAPDADSRVSGSERAWVKAFAPGGDRGELEISGDRALANAMLDGLALSVGHPAAAGGGRVVAA
jgi:hypothetical protein